MGIIGNGINFAALLLFMPVYEAGFCISFLLFIRGDKKNLIPKAFIPFNEYGRYLGTMLLVGIYTFLWSLLLIIPGIVKGLSYSMTAFILKDNQELSYNEAIEQSMDMMNGYKWKLFVLILSFIGWGLLCVLTIGIGFLWLIPYMQITQVAFYEDIKAEYETKNNVIGQ
jgi:uncharacterized membrane protein